MPVSQAAEGRESVSHRVRLHGVSDGRNLLALTAGDVSVRERRRMVRDEDRRFRVIFDGAPRGMLGYRREELRAKCLRDLMHPDDAEKEQQLFQQLAEGKRTSYERELGYRGCDSATAWVRLNVSLVRGADGKPQFAMGMTEHVTERKRAALIQQLMVISRQQVIEPAANSLPE